MQAALVICGLFIRDFANPSILVFNWTFIRGFVIRGPKLEERIYEGYSDTELVFLSRDKIGTNNISNELKVSPLATRLKSLIDSSVESDEDQS